MHTYNIIFLNQRHVIHFFTENHQISIFDLNIINFHVSKKNTFWEYLVGHFADLRFHSFFEVLPYSNNKNNNGGRSQGMIDIHDSLMLMIQLFDSVPNNEEKSKSTGTDTT